MRSTRRAAWLPLLLALASGPAMANERVAVFDPELFDTSGEGSRADQQQRLAMLGDELRRALAASGRYEVVDIAPQRARLAEGPALRGCGACAAEAAQALGAELGIVTVVQKVSNLILSITISVLEAAPSGARRAVHSAEIRGNTDESWRRGLGWLLRNRLLAPPEGPR
jgi:Protein of unknown function (DUF2380)